MIRSFLESVPVPTAGLALGVVALGKLFGVYAFGVEAACAIVAFLLILLVSAKAIFCNSALRSDLQAPVQAAVFGTFFMTCMQLSTYLAGVALLAAQIIWTLAVIGHFTLMAWFTYKRIRSFAITDIFATWFVCYVGIIVASVTSPALQLESVGQGLFWIGFAAYAVLLFIVTARYIKAEVPAPAAPTFCIYAAPMSLSLAGYLAVYEPNVVFVAVLEVLAQILFVLVLTQLPKFIRGGFYPSFAAMTFPFVITATALTGAVETLREVGIMLPVVCDVLIACEMAFAAVMTLYVLAKYTQFFGGKAREAMQERSTAKQAVLEDASFERAALDER